MTRATSIWFAIGAVHECQDFTSFLGTSVATSVPTKTKPTEGRF